MANISRVLSDIFFGTTQSKYAALAIFITIAILCFFILFTASDMSFEQRMVIVFFILLTSVPSILFSLFELTCIVTGGTASTRWWCYWLAWFITIVIVLYCLFIIISMFLSMASYESAMTTIQEKEEENKISTQEANEYAKNMMNSQPAQQELPPVQAHQEQVSQQAQQAPLAQLPEQMQVPQQMQVQQAPLAPQMEQSPLVSQVQQMQQMEQEPSFPQQYLTNSLDTMGYDSSDMYSPISNFANAPQHAKNESFVSNKMPTVQKASLPSAPSSPAPEPFSLQGKVNEFASNVSAVFGN